MPRGLLSKVGGVIALVSIVFLPIGGCGDIGLTGFEVLRDNDIPGLIKVLIGISILCAFIALFVKFYVGLVASGAIGITGLLTSYLIARKDIPVDLKAGAYLALIGFGLVLAEGIRQYLLVSGNDENTTEKETQSLPVESSEKEN